MIDNDFLFELHRKSREISDHLVQLNDFVSSETLQVRGNNQNGCTPPICPICNDLIDSTGYEALSRRCLDVFQLAGIGLSDKEIAASLFIAVNTVKVHMRSIFSTLHLHSRTELSSLMAFLAQGGTTKEWRLWIIGRWSGIPNKSRILISRTNTNEYTEYE